MAQHPIRKLASTRHLYSFFSSCALGSSTIPCPITRFLLLYSKQIPRSDFNHTAWIQCDANASISAKLKDYCFSPIFYGILITELIRHLIRISFLSVGMIVPTNTLPLLSLFWGGAFSKSHVHDTKNMLIVVFQKQRSKKSWFY